MDTRNWEQILEGLRVPFSAEVVAWKPQTISRERKRCLAVPYVDTQPYQERLDQVCPEWQDDYAIWFSDPQEALGRGGEKRIISGKVFVKCRLTIVERTRSDVGECELTDENALTSAKAQAFKRACAAFGLGRYLYDLPKPWVDFDAERGITEAELKKLEGLLCRYAETHFTRASGGGAASAAEYRLPARRPERSETAANPAISPLAAEANGQGVRARAGTNGHTGHPEGDANGRAQVFTGTASSPASSQPGGEVRRAPGASGHAPDSGLRQAGDDVPRTPLKASDAADQPSEARGDAGRPVSDALSSSAGRSEAAQPEAEQTQAVGPDRQQSPLDQPEPENEQERPAAPSNESGSVDQTAAAKPASRPPTGEKRREAPKSRAHAWAAEGAPAGKAMVPGRAQPANGVLSTPAGKSAVTPGPIDEGEGPVLCPIHNVPLQLLVTREGKALLLHKIEGGDAASPGYCNGQEVRQVARG